MNNEIIETKPRVIKHRKYCSEDSPTKEVNIWRGMDRKTYNYILHNRYYDDNILIRNGLYYLVKARQERSVATAV